MLIIRILRLLRIFRIFKLAEYVDEAETLMTALKIAVKNPGVFICCINAIHSIWLSTVCG